MIDSYLEGLTPEQLASLDGLLTGKHAPRGSKVSIPLDAYEAVKARAGARSESISRSGREIGPLHPEVNPDRRAAAAGDFELFCKTYFPRTFYLPFSPDHRKVIGQIQTVVREGGLVAIAMPRASGKSSLCQAAAVWAVLYGYRSYVIIIGADASLAARALDSIKTELAGNLDLYDDFPEVCQPIAALGNIANRCKGQLVDGRPTCMAWTAGEVVLPTIEGSAASGAIIGVAGLTGQIRGMSFTRPGDRRKARPDLVLSDDVQNDESARSPSQSDTRERLITGAVLGLAGPKKRIACLFPCTIISPGDLADRFLNRERHPEWQGTRTQMVYAWPTNTALWGRYAEIWKESMRQEHGGTEATEFYRQHREEMDRGAVVAWPERHDEKCLSTIQQAFNLRLISESMFMAEYQNTPMLPDAGDLPQLTASQIAERCNGIPRGTAPVRAEHITAAIDLHDTLLYWAVVAWTPTFTGFVLDYGAYPGQPSRIFTLRKAAPTLADVHPGGREACLRAGLTVLAGKLIGKFWPREDGTSLRITRLLIDSGYVPEVVHDVVMHTGLAAIVVPSRGVGIGATSRPMSEWELKPGERRGFSWILARTSDRATRVVRFDANAWKTFLHARLAVPLGDPGSLSLYGSQPGEHQLLSEHLTAESPTLVSAKGRTVAEWQMRPGQSDNHWLDTLGLCAVGASFQGCCLEGTPAPPARKRVCFSEQAAAARARREEQQRWNTI
jgi:hypothetical protein